jgi:hypothetical protein
LVQVVGGLAVAVGADVVGGAVVLGGGAGAVVVGGAVVVFPGAGAMVVVPGAGAVVVVAVGSVVGVVVTPLATLNFARRLEVVPSDHVNTTLMACEPSVSCFVSYGTAVPPAAVPAKSKGAALSVRTGGFVRLELSR